MMPPSWALNLFYEEPDPDRWVPLDRYPRRIIRRVVRGRPRLGGQRKVFLNLCAGLDRLGVPYRVNDYQHARRHSHEVACLIGKPYVLDRVRWENPILFGAAVFSHPRDDPDLLERLPVRRMLVPGEWVRAMFEPYYGNAVQAWPVGIDTHAWRPANADAKDIDVILYDKVMWNRATMEKTFVAPVRSALDRAGLRVAYVRYGAYHEEEFRGLVARSRSMVFLCEHESQGIAYQQVLSCDVPILAWDRGGDWADPAYHPHHVRFGPVTSVPYWNARCGMRFSTLGDFDSAFESFWNGVTRSRFSPREYVQEHLTLEQCARRYLGHVDAVAMSTHASLVGSP